MIRALFMDPLFQIHARYFGHAGSAVVSAAASETLDAINFIPELEEHESYFKKQLVDEAIVSIGMWYFGIRGSPYKLLFEAVDAYEEFR